jgi:membrane protease YdiL (CAAX protease family)
MNVTLPKIAIQRAAFIFIASTLYFFALVHLALPKIKDLCPCNPALHWFITGYLLFIPLLVAALLLARREGARSAAGICAALGVRRMSARDRRYAAGGLALVFLGTGAVFAAWAALHEYAGFRELSTTPWFMEFSPFRGTERLLLLIWMPMFAFNILGEELLWRGYVQARLGIRIPWAACSLLWACFHLPFGADLLVLLAPALIVIPYTFHITGNTLVGIVIHAVYNGPLFVLVSLGVIGA